MRYLKETLWRSSWPVGAAIIAAFLISSVLASLNMQVSGADPAPQTTPHDSTDSAGAGEPMPFPGNGKPKTDAMDKGLEHFRKQEWLLAVEQFTKAIEQFPEDPSGYLFRARAQTKLGKANAARIDYGEVVRLVDAPSQVPALRARASAFLELGRHADALQDLKAALVLQPNDEDSLMLRGRTHEMAKELKSAVKDYSQVIRLSPKSADAFLRRGNVYSQVGRHQEGLADQKRAIRLGGISGGELIYQDANSGAVFHFVFIAPATHWIGYDEQQRIAVAGQARQLLFGHNATPIQEVQLRQGYFILDREITLSQYDAFKGSRSGDDEPDEQRGEADLRLGTDASKVPESLSAPRDPNGPVTNVSWTDAMKFCEAMQQRIGLAVRLPTEVEWECAARYERSWLYPWGDETDENFPAWAEKPDEGPRPLNISVNRDVTPAGIHDMAGNVSEWCLDEYRNSLFEQATARLPYVPTASSLDSNGKRNVRATHGKRVNALSGVSSREMDGFRRSYRGGSFNDNPFNCQIPVRRAMPASEANPAIGFRPVLLMRLEK